MRIVAAALVSLALGAGLSSDVAVHRTTPRATIAGTPRDATLGVPGGRAWGIESALIPLPEGAAAVAATLEVRDASIGEAFVRVAYYDRSSGRPRELAIVDSQPVCLGADERVGVLLAPPPGAVAYRMRVLARVAPGAIRSDAVALRISELATDRARAARAPLTRLEAGVDEFP